MKEEIKPVILNGKIIPVYYITNTGKVFGKNNNGQIIQKKLHVDKGIVNGRGACVSTNLSIPIDLIDDYEYRLYSRNRYSVRVKIHKLVMNAFRPLDEYPPKQLEHCWKDLPPEVKQWVADTVIINHIDHDSTNNNVTNLEYCTQKHNAREAVKFYNGNVSNKNKNIVDVIEIPNVNVFNFV